MRVGTVHTGIIIRSRQQVGVRWQIRALLGLSRRVSGDEWANRLEYL